VQKLTTANQGRRKW